MPSGLEKNARSPALVRGACIVVGVLAIFGALTSYQVSRAFSAQYPDAYGAARAEIRFAPVLERVPVNAELGYLTDLDPKQSAYAAAFLAAQYAVAPRLLMDLHGYYTPDLAIGNFSKPQDFAAAGEARGYSLVADLGNGVVLFRRKSP